MAILSAMVAALSSYYPDALDADNVEQRDITIARLVSKVRTIAAFAYKKSIGQPFVYPKNSLSYCANFLNMMFSVPAEDYEIDPELVQGHEPPADPARRSRAELLDEHGARGRLAARRTSSPRSARASARSGGPLHGGANQEVLEMLERHPRRRRRRHEVHRAGEGQEQRLQADGLRPPRLQELRPAREDHQERGRQGAGASSASTTPCSTSPRRSKRRR